MTIIKLAVTEFAQRSIQIGDIDQGSGLAQVEAELGAEIHRKIQKRRSREKANYQVETSIRHCFNASDNVRVDVSGRIDGTWLDEDGVLIFEEIKSTYNLRKLIRCLDQDSEHPYLMQLRLYVWMKLQNFEGDINPHLLLIGAGSGTEVVYPVTFDLEEMNSWIERKLEWVQQTWLEVTTFRNEQKVRGETLKFPFAKARIGQELLIEDVTDACTAQRSLLAQAPTGLGKTAAILLPTLKTALLRGDKLFHVTPKNSQLREAEKLFEKLNAKESTVKAMIVTAKAKICFQEEVLCNPDHCRFAKGHYDKVNEHGLLSSLKSLPIINQAVLQDYGTRYEVCPYELGRQMMPWVDALAGDYHYALSPNANFKELAALPLAKDDRPLLTIDEAHNLSERAIDWYTASVAPIPTLVIEAAPRFLQKRLHAMNAWLSAQLAEIPTNTQKLSNLDRPSLIQAVHLWSLAMPKFLESLAGPVESNPVVTQWFSWRSFVTLTELPEGLFFAMGNMSTQSITLHCANAGPLISDKLLSYPSVIAFSATLKPFDYHMRMCGFDSTKTDTKEYASPFPTENRRIIAIPQVSTAWKDRSRNIPRIADVINRVTSLRRGNYIAFFPSFELLRQTLPFISSESLEIFEQPSRATAHWTKGMLKTLKKRRDILLLAVQGGVLSEGVDLPGESLIGAFVIGPALAMVTAEREERRKLLDKLYGNGFSFAYIHPAMARSVQSAGRVVRTPKDRGIVILIDPRFMTPLYSQAFPKDWLPDGDNPSSLVSRSILKDVQTFWDN